MFMKNKKKQKKSGNYYIFTLSQLRKMILDSHRFQMSEIDKLCHNHAEIREQLYSCLLVVEHNLSKSECPDINLLT